MKLFNIFKKETKKNTNSSFQKLEKNQLSKVIGGAETTTVNSSVAGGPLKGVDVKLG